MCTSYAVPCWSRRSQRKREEYVGVPQSPVEPGFAKVEHFSGLSALANVADGPWSPAAWFSQSICLAEGLPSTPFGFSVGRVMPYARPAADIAYVVIIKRSAVRAAQCRSLSIEGCAILSFGKVFTQRNGLLAVAAGNVEVPFACLDSLTHAAYQTTVRFAQEWLCLKVMHLECSFLGRAHQTTFNALLHSRH